MCVYGRLCHECFVNVAGQFVHNAAENKYLTLSFILAHLKNEERKKKKMNHTLHKRLNKFI